VRWPPSNAWGWTSPHTVLVVIPDPEVLDVLEGTLGQGCYKVVILNSYAHAYSEIKRAHPDLVVLRTDHENPLAFQLLTMLSLDSETKDIALTMLTKSNDPDDEDDDEETDGSLPWLWQSRSDHAEGRES
jgi:CheY-like chemotaxis protein